MNFCTLCASYYMHPGTCNCYISVGVSSTTTMPSSVADGRLRYRGGVPQRDKSMEPSDRACPCGAPFGHHFCPNK